MNKSERIIKIGIGLILMGFIAYWFYGDSTATCGTLVTPTCGKEAGNLLIVMSKPTLLTLLGAVLLMPFDRRSVAHYRWLWLVIVVICAIALPTIGLFAVVSLLWNPAGTFDAPSAVILTALTLCITGLIVGLVRLNKQLPGGSLHA